MDLSSISDPFTPPSSNIGDQIPSSTPSVAQNTVPSFAPNEVYGSFQPLIQIFPATQSQNTVGTQPTGGAESITQISQNIFNASSQQSDFLNNNSSSPACFNSDIKPFSTGSFLQQPNVPHARMDSPAFGKFAPTPFPPNTGGPMFQNPAYQMDIGGQPNIHHKNSTPSFIPETKHIATARPILHIGPLTEKIIQKYLYEGIRKLVAFQILPPYPNVDAKKEMKKVFPLWKQHVSNVAEPKQLIDILRGHGIPTYIVMAKTKYESLVPSKVVSEQNPFHIQHPFEIKHENGLVIQEEDRIISVIPIFKSKTTSVHQKRRKLGVTAKQFEYTTQKNTTILLCPKSDEIVFYPNLKNPKSEKRHLEESIALVPEGDIDIFVSHEVTNIKIWLQPGLKEGDKGERNLIYESLGDPRMSNFMSDMSQNQVTAMPVQPIIKSDPSNSSKRSRTESGMHSTEQKTDDKVLQLQRELEQLKLQIQEQKEANLKAEMKEKQQEEAKRKAEKKEKEQDRFWDMCKNGDINGLGSVNLDLVDVFKENNDKLTGFEIAGNNGKLVFLSHILLIAKQFPDFNEKNPFTKWFGTKDSLSDEASLVSLLINNIRSLKNEPEVAKFLKFVRDELFHGEQEIVKNAFEKGSWFANRTPVHLAAFSGYAIVMEVLLSVKPDVMTLENRTTTNLVPLAQAVMRKNTEMSVRLIEYDHRQLFVECPDQNNKTPIIMMVQNGLIEATRVALRTMENDVSIDIPTHVQTLVGKMKKSHQKEHPRTKGECFCELFKELFGSYGYSDTHE